ncbi:MAG: peptidoglycan-binding protein [Pseudomonadota bacterium]
MMNRFQMGRDANDAEQAGNGLGGDMGGNFRSFLAGPSAQHPASGFTSDPLELANASAEIRARQQALSSGPRASSHAAPRPHAIPGGAIASQRGQTGRFPHRSDHEANVSALREQIKQELAQLRGDLKTSSANNMAPKIDGELSALRGELAQIRNMVASHGGPQRQDQWNKLTRSMDTFNAHPPAAKSDIALLRDELAEMRAIVATSAREDSMRQLSATYADLAQRVDRNTAATKDDAARQALARLIQQVDATQVAVESLPSTRHLSNVEARIDGLGSSLEKVLGSRAEIDSNMLSALEGRLSQMADSIARLDANSHAMPDEQAVVLQRLEQRIANLAGQVQSSPSSDGQPLLEAMDAIGQRLDGLAAYEPAQRHQVDLIAQRLDDLSARLDQVSDAPTQSDALETILTQVSALQSKIDDASPRNMLPTLEQRLDSINQGLDRVATRPIEPDFSAIESQMQRMAAQIDGFASQDISSLEASVREMHQKLDTMPEAGPFDDLTGNRLERQISELASQLENSAAPQPADPARLAQLESQIANISALLNETNQHAQSVTEAMAPALAIGGADTAMAARFDALEERLSSQQASLLDAARQAAHEVASNQATGNDNSELLLKLAEDLDRLHVTAAETSDGTRQTFDAVHITLEKIVERLEQLELGGQPAATSTPAHAAAPAREMAVAEAAESNALLNAFGETQPPAMPRAAPFDSFDDLKTVDAPGLESDLPAGTDTPLEPGQMPQFGAQSEAAPLPPGVGTGNANDGMDFIAAARRAARAAADEAAPTDAPAVLAGDKPTRKSKKAKRAGQKAEGKTGASRVRRPIILASAAMLLALAAFKFAPAITGILSSEPEVAKTQVEPSAAMAEVADAAQNLDTDANGEGAEGVADAVARVIPIEPAATSDVAPVSQQSQAQVRDQLPAQAAQQTSATPIIAPELADNVGSASLRQAASEGNPAAMFEVALRYTEGRVVDKDSQMAFQWYQKAAEAGLAPAQFRLANFLEKGLGTEQDYDAAIMWYERAVQAGNARAMHNLAVLHTEETAGGQKVAEATKLFRDAAELGVRDSQFNLGIMYGRGLGVDLDLAESYKWFALAARAGDTEAAEKRDQVANAMLPEDLDKARIAAQAWQAKPLIEDANTVNIPVEWSADSPGATASNGAALSPAGISGETTGGIAIDSGNIARDTQSALLALGYAIGTADGLIGPKTSSAIQDFETRMGLPVTGQPSPALLQSMLSVAAGING